MGRFISLSLLVACLCILPAFAATALLSTSFKNGPGSWAVMGGTGSLRVSRDAPDLRDNEPALAFDYEIGLRKFGAAILPTDPGALTSMDRLHFWVKTDYPTTVIVIMKEKDGGNYSAMAWSPGGAWQEVRLSPRDFSLGERPTDPPDPDGKLDLDEVQGIGIADLGQLLGAGSSPMLGDSAARHAGKHTLFLSGFEALSGSPARKDNLSVDQFDTPQITWSAIGDVTLARDTSETHAPAAALESRYGANDNGIIVFARNLPPDIPANITHISFDVAAEKDAQLAFVLQQKGSGKGEGPRYNTVVEVRGGGKSDHRELAVRAFDLDRNGPADPAGALNISKSKSMAIVDAARFGNAGIGPNTIWISNIRLIAK